MLERLKRRWKQFRSAPAGSRFQRNYERRKESGAMRKIVVVVLSLASIALGVVLLVLPGPGILFIVIGLALIAEESLIVARTLDRADLWIEHIRRRWKTRGNRA